MPPKRSASPTACSSPTPTKRGGRGRGRDASKGPWTEAEDNMILLHRRKHPLTAWRKITEAVNTLPPGGRTVAAVRMRFQQVLKHAGLNGGDPALNEHEKEMLQKAVRDLDSGAERWFFVAARYNDLRKGKPEERAREMGEVAAKRWVAILKSGVQNGGERDKSSSPEKPHPGIVAKCEVVESEFDEC